jgi:hypothetical protein
MRDRVEDALVGAVCTVELAHYARAQADCPYLRGMAPEEVCVNDVAEVALKMLPEKLNGLMSKTGSTNRVCHEGSAGMPVGVSR